MTAQFAETWLGAMARANHWFNVSIPISTQSSKCQNNRWMSFEVKTGGDSMQANISLDSETQKQNAASPRLMRAG
jgi:hypothetical protein